MNKYTIFLVILQSSFAFTSFGQQFTFHSNSPFGIQPIKGDSTRATQKIMFSDYDWDGDLDLFHTGLDYFDETIEEWENIHYFIEMQENIGDKWNPQFAERIAMPENFPFPLGYFFATSGDLNGDGMTDFIVSAIVDFIGKRTLTFHRNTGGQEFEVIRLDSMGLPDFLPESFFIPELVDLDIDGDLDLLVSGFDPAFAEEDGADIPIYYYAKNIGTPTEPEFLGWFDNPYGLVPNPLVEFLTDGDIDNDGDMDLLGFTNLIAPDSITYLYFHENTPGPNLKPLFNNVLESPFGLPIAYGEEQFLFPNLVDIDGDGDLDLFVFHSIAGSNELRYYENNLCTGETNEMSVNLCEGESITIGGNIYTEGGEYTISFEGSDGCDSTILLSIELIPTYTVDLNESICEGESLVIGNETFTVAGNYTVYVVASNGCDSIVNLSLIVNENYNTNLSETLCEGQTYEIGGEIFTKSGQYEVPLISQAGCDSIITLNLNIIVVDTSVTIQQNTLTANEPFASYQWINCDSGENIPGATNQSYVALTTGNYAVSLTDGFGCSAVSECVSVIISGIEEDHLSSGITLYPNPSDSWIYILNETQYPVSTLTLINISGQVVEEIILNSKNSVDVSSLEKGVYFVKIKIKGLEIIKKLIVI